MQKRLIKKKNMTKNEMQTEGFTENKFLEKI